MNKVISRCPKCKKITFCAVCDTPDDILSVSNDIRRLKRQGRSVEMVSYEDGEAMPEWCDCGEYLLRWGIYYDN